MPSKSPWPTIHRERHALADDLDGLAPSDWATPSLCEGRTVHQTLGHIVATAKLTPPRALGGLARAGFRFDAMTERDLARETAGSPRDTVAELRAHAEDTTSPPGPVDSWLGETVVHSTDIRWPLGLEHEFPTDAVVRVADFYKGSNLLIGAKRRIAGLTLRATDVDWSTGSGPEVAGPILPLVMAMTGRRAALERLSGPGVVTLGERVVRR